MKIATNKTKEERKKKNISREPWCGRTADRQAIHVFRFIGHHFHHFRTTFTVSLAIERNNNNIKPQRIASRILFFSIRSFFVRCRSFLLFSAIVGWLSDYKMFLLLLCVPHIAPSEMASQKVRERSLCIVVNRVAQ